VSGSRDEIVLIAFLQAQNCTTYTGSWRHPASATDFLSARYYQRIARTLEDGCFDMAFFDDRLAMPDTYGRSHELAVRYGIRPVKLDPTVVMMAMAMATSHLGLGSTYSTTYYEPFHVARHFATLDHMTGGRAAWNVVTSLNDSEAANFGRDTHLEHDARYDRADEFLEIVTRLWASWDSDALDVNKADSSFADPTKVRRTDFQGEYLNLHGTFTVPPSPQGRPVLLQAGSSGRGLEFAGKWADVVFTLYASRDTGAKPYNAIKKAVAEAGRDPKSVPVAPAVNVIVGETEEIAREKRALLDQLKRPQDGLVLLCETFNVDLSDRPIDEPFTDAELAKLTFGGLRDRIIAVTGKSNPAVSDFLEHSGQGRINDGATLVGTPMQVVDQMETWLDVCCDGFVIAATSVPGSYVDFARLVVPELQRRGLAKTEYRGATLRENLGIPDPVSA
jgi:FMN-dependent oxidoreductase (nitrilotriacetate monooxygenase family)